jgi:hypothetical protein
MIKENITKKYSMYTPTINWGDALFQEAGQSFQLHNMCLIKYSGNTEHFSKI